MVYRYKLARIALSEYYSTIASIGMYWDLGISYMDIFVSHSTQTHIIIIATKLNVIDLNYYFIPVGGPKLNPLANHRNIEKYVHYIISYIYIYIIYIYLSIT